MVMKNKILTVIQNNNAFLYNQKKKSKRVQQKKSLFKVMHDSLIKHYCVLAKIFAISNNKQQYNNLKNKCLYYVQNNIAIVTI